MKFSDETLIAYVDGELDAAMRAEVDAALATDPELVQKIERHAALTAHIREAFDAVLDEPVPQHLLDATGSTQRTADVIDLTRRRDAKRAGSRHWSWPQWGAIAAAIVAGVAIGRYAVFGAAPLEADGGQVVARGALARALSSQLASAQTSDAKVRIGISFKAHSGEFCRTFVVDAGASGMACKGRGDWRVHVLAPSDHGGTGAYRMAASALPETVAREVDKAIDGAPFDAAQEKQALDSDWHK